MVRQFSGGGSTSVAIKANRKSSQPGATTNEASDTEGEADSQEDKRWPDIARTEVLSYDPFKLPTFLDPDGESETQGNAEGGPDAPAEPISEQEQRTTLMASLQSQGVDLVLMTSRGKVARIGDLDVHEGDLLEGFRVVEIHSRGIVLAEETRPLETETNLQVKIEKDPKKLRSTISSIGFSWLQGQVKRALGVAGTSARGEDDVTAVDVTAVDESK